VREPRCITLPGHAQLLACPDFYLTPAREEQALQQIERVLQQQGVIDIWAHTEEVISADQRATWQHVVNYAATQSDLWIAPLREITDWQHALSNVTHTLEADTDEMLVFRVANQNSTPLEGLTLRLPFAPRSVQVEPVGSSTADHTTAVQHRIDGEYLIIDMAAQQTIEVRLWRTN
jgi:DNA segregation ATPase FtsK/SpoIIIE-like protein